MTISQFPTVDVVLAAALAGFVLWGLWFGLIRTLGSLVGIVAGSVAASHFYNRIASSNTGKVIAFIALYIVANRLVALAVYLLEKLLNVASIIPGIKLINRIAGAALGFIEGAVVLGVVVHFANIFPFFGIRDTLAHSLLAPHLLRVGGIVATLFPQALRTIPAMPSRTMP